MRPVGITRDRVLWKLSDEDWHSVLRTNLDSAFYLLRAAVPAGDCGSGRDGYLPNESAEPADRISWLCTCE